MRTVTMLDEKAFQEANGWKREYSERSLGCASANRAACVERSTLPSARLLNALSFPADICTSRTVSAASALRSLRTRHSTISSCWRARLRQTPIRSCHDITCPSQQSCLL